MACGGEAATGLPVKAAAERGSGVGRTTGEVYSAFKITAGTVSVDAWSLCWPYLQCSAQRLAASGSIPPAMSLQPGICAAIAAEPGSLLTSTCGAAAADVCAIGCICPIGAPAVIEDDKPGQAYAAIVICARNSTLARQRASPRTKLRFMRAPQTTPEPGSRGKRRRIGRCQWQRAASMSAVVGCLDLTKFRFYGPRPWLDADRDDQCFAATVLRSPAVARQVQLRDSRHVRPVPAPTGP